LPNGGFGCAYCVHYTKSFCNLREVRITTDHWTVCANITYQPDNPAITDTFGHIGGIPVGGAEIKGSIFAITSDEGAYAQVPWLEDGEIHVVNSMRTCVVCQKSKEKGKGIAWRGEKYFFCSYAHYLSWRNQQIEIHNVDAEIMDEDFLRYFNNFRELKIIEENTTPEQRRLALKRDARKKRWIAIKRTFGWGIFIAIIFLLFRTIFN
jgi:YHS domain-containing protein